MSDEVLVRCDKCGAPLAESAMFGEFVIDEYKRALLIWDLIDEVTALRRGIGVTHGNGDPIKGLTDRVNGIPRRESISENIRRIEAAIAKHESARSKP